MKCGYDYDVMKAIFIAMLGRQVDNQKLDMDIAKECAKQFYGFCDIVTTKKDLANQLKVEGTKALKKEDKANE